MKAVRDYIFKKNGSVEPSISITDTGQSIWTPPLYGGYTEITHRGMHGSPDGKYIYVQSYGTPESIVRIELTNNNDLSQFNSTVNSKYSNNPYGFYCRRDGLMFYQKNVLSYTSQRVVPVAFNTNGATNITNVYEAPFEQEDGYTRSMQFSPDGLLFWKLTSGYVYQYELSTPFRLETKTTRKDFAMAWNYLQWLDDGKKACVVTGVSILLYEMSTPYDLSNRVVLTSIAHGISSIFNSFITDDNKYLYTISDGDYTLSLFNLDLKY